MERDAIQRGVARLMVQRHLSDLIRPDIGTADQITEMLTRCMAASPDNVPMKEITRSFRMAVNQMLLRRACRPPTLTIRTVEKEG
jgi:hypothetical protein